MTTLADITPAGGALETYSAELRQLGEELRDAVTHATTAARDWGAALESVADTETRRLGTAAVQRGLDRYLQLEAVLTRMSEIGDGATANDAIEQAIERLRTYDDSANMTVTGLATAEDIPLVTALAIEISLLVAVGNTAQHAPADTSVDIASVIDDQGFVVVTARERGRTFPGDHGTRLPLGQGSRLALWVCELAQGTMTRQTDATGVTVTIRVPAGLQARRHSDQRAADVADLELLHRISAGIQATHGFAQPLLEARWLAGGAAGARLSTALRQLTLVGQAHRQQLTSTDGLHAELATTLSGIRTTGPPTTATPPPHPVDRIAPWAAAQARYRLLATAELIAARLHAEHSAPAPIVARPVLTGTGTRQSLAVRVALHAAHDLLEGQELATLDVDVIPERSGVRISVPIEADTITW